MLLPQRPDKIIFRRKYRGGGHQNHHDLPCGIPLAYQHMAQKAVSGILIIGPYLKGAQHSPDRTNNRIRLLIFNQAVLHRHHLMGILLINSGYRISSPVMGKYRMYLMPVMERIFHPDYPPHRAQTLQKPCNLPLLHPQLLSVLHSQKLTSAAALLHRTELPFFICCPGTLPHRFIRCRSIFLHCLIRKFSHRFHSPIRDMPAPAPRHPHASHAFPTCCKKCYRHFITDYI